MGTPNVNYEQIIAYAAGMLTGAEAAKVESHLASHPDDSQTVARYRLAKQLIATDDSVEPSAAAIARARAIFAQHTAKPNRLGWLEAVDRFIARLVFDSRVQPVALRYADVGGRINLTYETERAEIDLQAERVSQSDGAERWRLIGQVSATDSPATPKPRPVTLMTAQTQSVVTETTSNERGGFSLDVAPGRYDLYLGVGEGVVVVPGIEVS